MGMWACRMMSETLRDTLNSSIDRCGQVMTTTRVLLIVIEVELGCVEDHAQTQ